MTFDLYKCGLAIAFVFSSAACSEGGGQQIGGVNAAGAGAGGLYVPPMGGAGTVAAGSGGSAGGGGMIVVGPTGGTTGGAGAAGAAGAAGGSGGMAGMAGMMAGGAGAMSTAGMGGSAGAPPAMSCLDVVTDYASEGPFEYAPMHSGSVKIWVPEIPAGCKVPIVHLANGTGATCSAYQNVLNRLASHGFLTTCYENTNTGAGTQGVEAITTVIEMFGDKAANAIGSTGHSQGGQAAYVVLSLAEDKWGDEYTYAGLAMQPASGFGSQPTGGWTASYAKIDSPMFMFSGTADILVSAGWVQQGFDALNDQVEAYNWSAAGSTHIPTPQPETMEVSIPWFRWKLLGDQKACMAFKALEGAGTWTERDSQNVKECM